MDTRWKDGAEARDEKGQVLVSIQMKIQIKHLSAQILKNFRIRRAKTAAMDTEEHFVHQQHKS